MSICLLLSWQNYMAKYYFIECMFDHGIKTRGSNESLAAKLREIHCCRVFNTGDKRRRMCC